MRRANRKNLIGTPLLVEFVNSAKENQPVKVRAKIHNLPTAAGVLMPRGNIELLVWIRRLLMIVWIRRFLMIVWIRRLLMCKLKLFRPKSVQVLLSRMN